jgi:two-component system sensor histidine kinase HydH
MSVPDPFAGSASGPADAPRPPVDEAAILSRVAAGLAHEIKNPLSTMAINLALLEEEIGKGAAVRNPERPELNAREERSMKKVRTLQREVRRLEGIVEEFLRFARGGEINRRPADLVAVVREALEFVAVEDDAAGIRHHFELPSSLPLAMLDPGAFKQALLNLLVNARQAMPSGGEIIVRVRRQGNHAELTITDTGVGMDEHELGRCFDLYWSTKKSGTGLGLATTRRIVEQHGGTISVISERGRGTSFSIVLPLVVEITGAGGHAPMAAGRPAPPSEQRPQPRDVELEEPA